MLRSMRHKTIGHKDSLTRVRAAFSEVENHPGSVEFEEEDASDIVITCSKDGLAGVWLLDDMLTLYSLLCFLVHRDEAGDSVEVNDACAYIDRKTGGRKHEQEDGQSFLDSFRLGGIMLGRSKDLDSATIAETHQNEHLLVVTGSADGCTRLWAFPRRPVDGKWRYERFAESEMDGGILSRHTPDAVFVHQCDACMHQHAVLSIALLPSFVVRRTEGEVFNLVVGTTEGYASVLTVCHHEEVDDERSVHIWNLKRLDNDIKMNHGKFTVVTQVAVAHDFLDKSCLMSHTKSPRFSSEPRAAVLIATCGQLGRAKLWRLRSHPTEEKPLQLEHIRTFEHEDDDHASLGLRSVGFTPKLPVEAFGKRFIVTSSFDPHADKQHKSRIFVWSLEDLHETKEVHKEAKPKQRFGSIFDDLDEPTTESLVVTPSRKYVFQANNFIFWLAEEKDYLYIILSAPDGSIKIVRFFSLARKELVEHLLWVGGGATDGPAVGNSKLESPDRAHIDGILYHTGPVNYVVGVWKNKSSKRIISASDDRTAIIWDPELQQIDDHIRPATLIEMCSPLLLQVVAFTQLCLLSLDEIYSWNKPMIEPTRVVMTVVSFDFMSLSTHMDQEVVDTARIIFFITSFLVVVAFLCIVISDRIGGETAKMQTIETSQQYREEIRAGETGLGRKQAGPAHRKHRRARIRQDIFWWLIYLCSTILVMPIARSAALLFEWCDDRVARYRWKLRCTGWYVPVIAGLLVLGPLYIWLILPFSVCGGDATVVTFADLLHPRNWLENALQKNTQVDKGPANVYASQYFIERVIDIVARVSVPFIMAMHGFTATTRAILICLVHAVLVGQVLMIRSYVASSFNTLFVGSRVLGFWAAVLSIASAAIGDPSSTVVATLWYLGTVVILATTFSQSARFLRREEDDLAMRIADAMKVKIEKEHHKGRLSIAAMRRFANRVSVRTSRKSSDSENQKRTRGPGKAAGSRSVGSTIMRRYLESIDKE